MFLSIFSTRYTLGSKRIIPKRLRFSVFTKAPGCSFEKAIAKGKKCYSVTLILVGGATAFLIFRMLSQSSLPRARVRQNGRARIISRKLGFENEWVHVRSAAQVSYLSLAQDRDSCSHSAAPPTPHPFFKITVK